MNTLAAERLASNAVRAVVTNDTLTFELADGREVSAPLAWYPRLVHGTARERQRWRLIGEGEGVHWPELDEDISVENLLRGEPSGESQASFKKWLAGRARKSKGS